MILKTYLSPVYQQYTVDQKLILGVSYCEVLLIFDQKFENYARKITQSITEEFVFTSAQRDNQPTRTIDPACRSNYLAGFGE
jgi:hypothetical protein